MWEKIKKAFIRGRKKPTMVFSVIGDSVSYVPRLWPVTVFQMALIEAAKSGGNILPLKKKIMESYQNKTTGLNQRNGN